MIQARFTSQFARLHPCDCQKSVEAGMLALMRRTLIRFPLAVRTPGTPIEETLRYEFLDTCAYCDKVLQAIDFSA